MKLAWATDIHLDHAGESARRKFCQSVQEEAEAAGYLKGVLAQAAKQYAKVIVATHIPPFREAAWYQGRPSADDYLPFFSCKAVGDVLLEVARSHPKSQILVLCGHTHGGGEVQVAENLLVVTGAAEYGRPEIQQIMEVE